MNTRNRVWRWFALLSVLAVVVAACGPGEPGSTTTAPPGATTTTGGTGTTQPVGPGVTPGLADCDVNPLTCNTAERQDGGQVNMIIGAEWNGWNHNRSASGSVYVIQALEGISTGYGYFEPDASWTWDSDYLDGEPELLSTEPLSIRYKIQDNAVWYDSVARTTHPVTVDDIIYDWYHNSGKTGCYDHAASGAAEPNVLCPIDDGYVEDPDLVIHCAATTAFPAGCDSRAIQSYEDIASIEADSADGKTYTVTYRDDYFNAEWYASLTGATYPAWKADELDFDWRNDPAAMAESSYWFENNFPTWSAGPYYIERGILPTLTVMVPNPEWWGAEQPTLDTLSKQVNPTLATYVQGLRNGDFHGGWTTPTLDLLAELRQAAGEIHSATGTGGSVWGHVDFNMNRVPEAAIRQAVFTAIDVQGFITDWHGEIDPPLRKNVFFPQSDGRFENHTDDLGIGSGDIDRARQVLSDAGYDWNSAGALLDLDGSVFRDLVFGYTATAEERRALMEYSQAAVAEIGITIADGGNPALGALLGSGEWDLVVFGWSGSPLFTNSPAQLYSCGSGSNFGGFCNAEFDVLADEIRNSTDLAEAAVKANRASEIVVAEEFFTLPLNDSVGVAFVANTVANVRDNHFSSLRGFYNQAAWGIVAGA